ncbi:HAD-IIA family hydrolase [Rhizobium sp. SAFR-030]|uniref:HAD-IIA family hydrolase n=1 Tax=Rhizobium sp. SAFR-030 TaxID=3387277 RepID=UPI003F80D287
MTQSSGRNLPDIRGIIADLDGVVFRGNTPIESAVQSFAAWREAGIPYCFVTNNSTRTTEEVAAKLSAMGVLTDPSQVISTATGTRGILRRTWPKGGRAYVLGAPSLEQAVVEAGFEIAEERVDCVVAGLDKGFTYARLDRAVSLVMGGARLIGTNPDVLLPKDGGFEPGAGSILAAIVAATRAEPLIVGKPQPHLIQDAVALLGIDHGQVIMIGDQLETDIVAAQRAGVFAVLVETGVPNPSGSGITPDLTVSTLTDLQAIMAGRVQA